MIKGACPSAGRVSKNGLVFTIRFTHTLHSIYPMLDSSSTDPSSTSSREQARWFADEVYSHDGQLKAYLRGAYPAVRDVDDLVQESYLRGWKTKLARPVLSAKSFLFQIARHLAIDVLRKDRATPLESLAGAELATLPVAEERPHGASLLSYQEKVDLLSDALARLPGRCRDVVYLRKLKSLSQKEVAARLGISVRTVESQYAVGMKRCEDYLRKHGIESFCRDEK